MELIMKILYTFIVLVTLTLLSSCSINYGVNTKEFQEKNKGNDGSSYEKAIIILRSNEREGIRDEYLYIASKYLNFKRKLQALSEHNSKYYDILTVTIDTGEEKHFYFDISNFFGKRSLFQNRW
jgi:hypothetical protein